MWRSTLTSVTNKAKLSLSGRKNPNPTRTNLVLDDSVAEQDGVVIVVDFVAIVVAVMAMGDVE